MKNNNKEKRFALFNLAEPEESLMVERRIFNIFQPKNTVMHCESKTEKGKQTKWLNKSWLDFVSDSQRLQMILNWLKC